MTIAKHWRGLTAASLLCVARAAAAQVVTPGVVDDFLRQPPHITPEQPQVPLLPQQPALPPRLKAEVHVSGVEFGHTSLYTQEQLQALARPHLKPRMSLAEIQEIAQIVTDQMRADGYLLASAVVPAQKLKNGVVRIEILEGKLESIRFHGNLRYSDAFLKPYLEPLTAGPALTTGGLERGLLLLNELPGIAARGTLSSGTRLGASDLDVDVTETRYRAGLGLNNYGSPELGRFRSDASLDLFNPLHLGDHANLRLIDSSDNLLKLGRFAYDIALAPGWRASLAVARVDYKVAGSLSALNLSGNSLTRDASLAYALLRTRATNLTWSAGMRDIRTSQQALDQSLGSTAVHAGYTQLTGYTTLGGGLTSGIAGLSSNGKGEPAAGTPGTGIRLKSEFDVSHVRPLPGNFELSQRVAATISPDTLPDTEKFSLGGPDSVRAFPIAQLRGDQGMLSATELRRRFALGGAPAYAGVFFDTGFVYMRQPGLPAARDALSGAGVTFSVMNDRHFRFKVDYARQFGGALATDGGRERVWLTGTWLF